MTDVWIDALIVLGMALVYFAVVAAMAWIFSAVMDGLRYRACQKFSDAKAKRKDWTP